MAFGNLCKWMNKSRWNYKLTRGSTCMIFKNFRWCLIFKYSTVKQTQRTESTHWTNPELINLNNKPKIYEPNFAKTDWVSNASPYLILATKARVSWELLDPWYSHFLLLLLCEERESEIESNRTMAWSTISPPFSLTLLFSPSRSKEIEWEWSSRFRQG